jgi:hypothetical protein
MPALLFNYFGGCFSVLRDVFFASLLGVWVRVWQLPSSSMRDIYSCVSALPLSLFF